VKLEDLGVTRDESSRWQRIATVPAPKFERAVAEHKSEAAIAALAPRKRAPRPINPAARCCHCEIHCPGPVLRRRLSERSR
jgi:hypothetical protein